MQFVRQLKIKHILTIIAKPIFNTKIDSNFMKMNSTRNNSYKFCSNMKDQIQDIQEQQKFPKFTLQEIINQYQNHKNDDNIAQVIRFMRLFSLYLKYYMKGTQKQLIFKYCLEFLQEFNIFLKTIPMNALLTDHRVGKKKIIIKMVAILSYNQLKNLFYARSAINMLIRTEDLANILLYNFHIFNLKEKSIVINFFLIYHQGSQQYIKELKIKIKQALQLIKVHQLERETSLDIYFFVKRIKDLGTQALLNKQITDYTWNRVLLGIDQWRLKKLSQLVNQLLAQNSPTINKNSIIEKLVSYQQKYLQQKNVTNFLVLINIFSTIYCQLKNAQNFQIQLLDKIRNRIIQQLQFLVSVLQKDNRQLSKEEIKLKQLINQSLKEVNSLLKSMIKLKFMNNSLISMLEDIFFIKLHSASMSDILKNISLKIKIFQLKNEETEHRQFKQELKLVDKIIQNSNVSIKDINRIYKKSQTIPYQTEEVYKKITSFSNSKLEKTNPSTSTFSTTTSQK